MFLSTYAMSDIHGLKDRYDTMLEALTLQNEDALFVLEDVIGYGKDGIAILLDTMNRDDIYMLLRNHEYVMKQYYEAVYYVMIDMQEAWVVINRWRRNHCSPATDVFEHLNERKQYELLNYLDELPIAICSLKVHEELFHLAHSSAQPQLTHSIATQQDMKDGDVTMECFVWDRMDVHERLSDNRSVIAGHTPTLFFQEVYPYATWTSTGDVKTVYIMDIDCGHAANDIHSGLGVVYLDTKTVQCF